MFFYGWSLERPLSMALHGFDPDIFSAARIRSDDFQQEFQTNTYTTMATTIASVFKSHVCWTLQPLANRNHEMPQNRRPLRKESKDRALHEI